MSDETAPPISPEEGPLSVSAFPTLEEMAALLPQYEFHDILGIGGMGAVYLARQTALDRWVAIKLLPEYVAQNEEEAGRFITEARSMAKLTHAHIAAVYDFGQTSHGHLFLVMEYVAGMDLHRLIHQDAVTPARIRSLVPQLCDALEYAHSHNIIHRDIKPANILITEDWQAKIVDFGLARDKDNEASGEVEYGTPDYVAPERLQPDALVDHRADIYALGVVIHEMFTKLTPRSAGAAACQGVPAEYSSVISRCMMTDPARRFQKCSEIRAFLQAAAIAASVPASAPAVHRAPPPQLQARIRQPKTSSVPQKQGSSGGWLWAAAIVVLLVIGGWYVQQQRNSKAAAQASQDAKGDKNTTPSDSAPTTAGSMANGAMAQSPTIIGNATEGPFKPDAGDFAILKRLKGHKEIVFSCAILADQGRAVSGGHDDTIIVWDIATGAVLRRFPSPIGDIHGIEAAKDGKTLLLYTFRNQQVAIFDIEEGKTIASIKAPGNRLTTATWSADQKSVYLLCNATDGGVYQWDPAKGAVLQQFSAWPRAAYNIFSLPASTPDGASQLLVIGSTMKPNPNGPNPNLVMDKPWASLFSEPDHRLIRDLPAYTNIRNRFALSPDGNTLVAGLGVLFLLDVPELTTRSSIQPPQGVSCSYTAWAGQGRLLVSGYSNPKIGNIIIREAETGTELANLNTGLRANMINISQDERWMVVSGFPLDGKNPKPDDFDVLVIRLPDLNQLGSAKGFQTLAARQLAKLEKVDPELSALRTQAVPPDSLVNDEQLRAQLRDLTSKYGAALTRSAATASPKDQLAMRAEADAIAAGSPVPDPTTDVATSGDHKRFRGIYRQQTAQLEKRRMESADAMHKALETGVRDLSAKRQQAGDRLGAARCDALLASVGTSKPFSEVVQSAFATSGGSTTPKAPGMVGSAPPGTPPPAPLTLTRTPETPIPVNTSAPKVPFANGVKIEVAIGRPSKTEGGDFDDEMQVINPRVKLTNTSTTQAYEGYTANFMLYGESTIDLKVIKVLQQVSFPISLPIRQTFENKLPSVTTQFDTTGAKFGFKYQGWVVQVTGPQGEIVFTKSTSPSFEKLTEQVKALKAELCYDKKLMPVPEPELRE